MKKISALVMLLMLLSCSSPHSDGEKAAKAFNESEIAYQENLNSRVGEFVDKFDSYGFVTRTEARQKLSDIMTEVRNDYENDVRAAETLYARLRTQNSKDLKDIQLFELGFAQTRNYINVDTTGGIPMQQLNSLIKTIIPPKPTVERIKQDLVGHTWQDKEDGYFGTDPQSIKDGTVKELNIISESAQGNSYMINAVINIQDREGAAIFKVNSDIKYLLGEADDWIMDYMGSNSVEIQKTGMFDKYITARIDKGWAESSLELTNHSDATLIVGGKVLMDGSTSKWEKFCVKVEPNSTKSIGGWFIPNIIEYEIHFVERK